MSQIAYYTCDSFGISVSFISRRKHARVSHIPCMIRSLSPTVETRFAEGDSLVDLQFELVAGRVRPNTLRQYRVTTNRRSIGAIVLPTSTSRLVLPGAETRSDQEQRDNTEPDALFETAIERDMGLLNVQQEGNLPMAAEDAHGSLARPCPWDRRPMVGATRTEAGIVTVPLSSSGAQTRPYASDSRASRPVCRQEHI